MPTTPDLSGLADFVRRQHTTRPRTCSWCLDPDDTHAPTKVAEVAHVYWHPRRGDRSPAVSQVCRQHAEADHADLLELGFELLEVVAIDDPKPRLTIDQPPAYEEASPRTRRDAFAVDWADPFGRVWRHYFGAMETAQSTRAEMARSGRTVVLVELEPFPVDAETAPDCDDRTAVRRCENQQPHDRHPYWRNHAAIRRTYACPGAIAGTVITATAAELEASHLVETAWTAAAGRYQARCQCGRWRSRSWASRAPASLEGLCHQVEEFAQASGAVVIVRAEAGR